MQNTRTWYFPANDCRVVTGIMLDGAWGARLEEETRIRGRGHSRLSAIADLADAIEKEGSINEREPYGEDVMQEAAE